MEQETRGVTVSGDWRALAFKQVMWKSLHFWAVQTMTDSLRIEVRKLPETAQSGNAADRAQASKGKSLRFMISGTESK